MKKHTSSPDTTAPSAQKPVPPLKAASDIIKTVFQNLFESAKQLLKMPAESRVQAFNEMRVESPYTLLIWNLAATDKEAVPNDSEEFDRILLKIIERHATFNAL